MFRFRFSLASLLLRCTSLSEVTSALSREEDAELFGAELLNKDEDVRDDDDEDDEEDGDWRLGLSAGPIIGVGGDLPSCEPKP